MMPKLNVKDSWKLDSKLANQLGIDKSIYEEDAELRNLFVDMGNTEFFINKNRTTITQLMEFRDSIEFKAMLPAVKETIIDRIEALKKEIDNFERIRKEIMSQLEKVGNANNSISKD